MPNKATEMNICFLVEINKTDKINVQIMLFLLCVIAYSYKNLKNIKNNGIARPSDKILFEYMEPRLAAKRHKRETPNEHMTITTYKKRGVFNTLCKYVDRIQMAHPRSNPCPITAASRYRVSPPISALKNARYSGYNGSLAIDMDT